jgi:hypothetical protein
MFIKNKFSTYIWKMRLFALCIVAVLLSGCHKKDKTAPILQSQLLTIGNSTYNYLDTLYIQSECFANDEFGLASVQFTIQDLNAKVWHQKSISFSSKTSAWSGIVAIPLNNRYMPSGDYFVQVTLDDGTYINQEVLSFSFIECPTSRTQLFFGPIDNNQPIENWINPSNPILWNVGSELQLEFTDPYHQLIWAHHTSSPIVYAYSPMGSIPEWTCATASLSSIKQMIIDPANKGAWILSEDGGIELINEKGMRLKNATEEHTEEIGFNGNYIALSQIIPGSPNQVVIKNKDTWGHHHTWVHGKAVHHIFAWSQYIGIVFFENNVYRIALLNMDNLLPVNWHPLQQITWNSAPLILSESDELWVAADGVASAYNLGGEMIMGPHNVSPSYWIKSNYDQSIWMIDNGQVIQMNPINGQPIWTSPSSGYSAIWEMTNK